MIRLELLQYVTEVSTDAVETIVVTFRGGHKIFGSYIPPVDSIYYDDTSFTSIPNIFRHDDQRHVIIGGGDLNSRVGDVKQKLPVLDAKYRPNVDTHVNTHGRSLKRICNSFNCFILNNLDIGDIHCDGAFTYFKGGKKSQNDLGLSNSYGLRYVKDFSIHNIGWNFSDHFPISTTVQLNLYDATIPEIASADILTSSADEVSKRMQKIQSPLVDWEGYQVIASREIELMVEDIDILRRQPDSENLDSVVKKLTSKLYTAAKTCERKPDGIAETVNPELSAPMITANEVLIKYSEGLCSWEEWDDVRKTAVSSISKNLYARNVGEWCETWRSRDSKKLWDKIDWKGSCKGDDISNEFPELKDLANQFQSKDNSSETEYLPGIDFGDTRDND